MTIPYIYSQNPNLAGFNIQIAQIPKVLGRKVAQTVITLHNQDHPRGITQLCLLRKGLIILANQLKP